MRVYILIETRIIDSGFDRRNYKFIEEVFASKDRAESERKRLQEESKEFANEMISFVYDVEEYEVSN